MRGIVVSVFVISVAFVLILSLLPRWVAAPARAAIPSDAMVILGGDAGDRVAFAVSLHRLKLAPVAVVTGLEDGADATKRQYLNWRVATLVEAGMPKDSIILEAAARNSREEAVLVRGIADSRGWKRILVVSDPPHMRRLQIIWDRASENGGPEVVLVASTPSWWRNSASCWLQERCAQSVILESIKLLYAFLSPTASPS